MKNRSDFCQEIFRKNYCSFLSFSVFLTTDNNRAIIKREIIIIHFQEFSTDQEIFREISLSLCLAFSETSQVAVTKIFIKYQYFHKISRVCIRDVLWVCVRIEDEGRRCKRREEMRKQKAGLETKRQVEFARNLLAIGRTMYFARGRQYDKHSEK